MNPAPKDLPRFRITIDEVALGVVVVAAYLVTLFDSPTAFAAPQGFILVSAGVAFFLFSLNGLAYCKSRPWRFAIPLYFAIQVPLGLLILYLSNAQGWLVLLPLISQATLTGRKWMLLVATAAMIGFTGVIAEIGNWDEAIKASVLYFPAIVFVVIFTEITRREQHARAEVERLAKELSQANTKLREYAAQVEELATTKERNRLAREIHDGLGHYLTAINMQIEAARAVIEADQAQALDALSKAQSLTKEGLTEVRRSVAALRSSPIENRPLREALGKLADECRASGLVTELVVIGTPRPLAPPIELALYRAAEESLTNIRRHAHATRADITLDYSAEKRVGLKIQDNGIGAENPSGGFGLLGVRERTQLLGGHFHIDTAVGKGFSLQIEVPE